MADAVTLDGLRTILWEDIAKLREGETSAATVNAVCNATGKILSTVKIQMEYYRLTGKQLPEMALLNSTNDKI